MRTAEIVLGLVVLATAVAAVADRIRVPAPSLLVLAGLGVGLLPGVPAAHVAPELISLVVLPPLLYAAAIDVVVDDLRAVMRSVAVLALGLVIASAFVVAAVVHLIRPEISFEVGLVLGAILASTDPVAVSALARRLHLPPRLLALVQGESLLNDATSLVLFRVLVAGVAAGHLAGPVIFPLKFLGLGAGGAAVGLVCAAVVDFLHRRTQDDVMTTVIALLAPYAAFVTAEVAHTSGVTAVVIAGLYRGRRREATGPTATLVHIDQIYGVVVFLLESVVFAIIGLELPTLIRALPANEQGFALTALALTGALLLIRIVWVTGVLGARQPRLVAVASWAGTRGVIPLAAALSVPTLTDDGLPFPHRDLLLVLAATCTAITLVVQGMTLRPLVERAGIAHRPE